LEEKIMTRRNLSDVLRQEATKDATDSEPKAEASDNSTKAASRTRKPSTSAPVEDQTAQIQELKAALAQGAEQEKAFQAQIKALEANTKQQQQQIKALESELGQGSKLKTELAEAKEVILQLSEANTQMSKTLDELKNPPQKAKAKAPLAVRPLPRHSLQLKPSENIDKPKAIDVGWMD
jgi:predicted RNase H-like nuclease (RuvC/YqgF family)